MGLPFTSTPQGTSESAKTKPLSETNPKRKLAPAPKTKTAKKIAIRFFIFLL
jgi:hypothetical protein